jgi:hypothetical protein
MNVGSRSTLHAQKSEENVFLYIVSTTAVSNETIYVLCNNEARSRIIVAVEKQ